LGEGEKGEERKKGDRKRWRKDQSGEKKDLGENTSKVGLGVEKGLKVIGRSKEMIQEELQWGTKIESKEESDGGSVQTSVRRRRVYEESIPVTKLPGRRDPFWKEVYGESRKKEDYVGKIMGRLGTLNWREWKRTGAPQWLVEGLREGFWWEVQPGLEGKKFPNAKMIAEQMEFVDKVWEEWKAQGVLESGIVKCICGMKVAKKKGPKKWRLCINNRPVNKKVLKWKVKFEGIEVVKELMKMFG
jgi:hypothetical protein